MTQSNPSISEERTTNQTPQARNAVRVIALFAVASLSVLGFLAFQAARTPSAPQLWTIVVIVAIVIAFMFAGLVVARRGRHERGIFLAFVPWLLLLVFIVVFVSGLGYVFMAVSIAIITLISGPTLPSRQATMLNIVGAVTAVIILLVDLFIPTQRIAIPGFDTVAIVVVGALVVVFGYTTLRQFGNYSLRAKLLVAFISVTVVATAVLGMFVVNNTTNILRDNLERELSQASISSAIRVGDLLNEQINQLTALSLDKILLVSVEVQNNAYYGSSEEIQAVLDARDAQWRAADEADNNSDPLVFEQLTSEVARGLNEYQKAFPDNIEIFVTDIYGGLAGTTNRTSDYYQADEGWWQAAYAAGEGAVFIADPEFDESAGAIGVNIALPLRNHATDEIIGILRTTYVISPLAAILAEGVGQTGESDLYFPGDVVSHIHEGNFEPVEGDAFERLQAVADQGMVEMEYEGTLSVVVQTPVQTLAGNQAVNKLGWVLALHQNQDEAFAPVNSQIQGTILVMLLVIALAVAAAVFLAQFLVRPIAHLTETAQEVAEGDLSARAEVETGDEIGALANTFNTMTSQLQETLGTLEQQVEDRTRALETSTEVSRRISTILDQGQLVREVVEQLRSAFGFYHAHIYLFDENKSELQMAGGTGEAGQAMLARGHTIPIGQGLVGRSAESNQIILVPDVSQEGGWLANPLLPDTKAEVAVPIAIGPNVLGVLDVQHNVVDGLSESDANLIQAIANQVAIASQNAQAYTRAQQQADREALMASVGQQIQASNTIEDVLKVAVRELGQALGARRASAELRSSSRSNNS